MTVGPNPFVLGVVARQRRHELLIEADRYRLARLATSRRGADRQPLCFDLAAVGAVLIGLALRLVPAKGRAASPVLDQSHLDRTAALAVGSGRV